MVETIFAILTTLGGAVITYLLNENKGLKESNQFLMESLFQLTAAIEFTDSVSDESKLHDVAKQIKEELKIRLSENRKNRL
jgi:predicted amino acid-binding ACT domain protein